MNTVALGKRIKEARIARKLTQSEVVGDFITRNMLSQIESGVATPSIKTLQYLAKVLSIPAAELIDDEKNQEQVEDRYELLLFAKECLKNERYAEVVELQERQEDDLLDEIQALSAKAYYELAKKTAEEGNLVKAVDFAQRSIICAEKGVYANDTRKTEGILLLNQFASKLKSSLYDKK